MDQIRGRRDCRPGHHPKNISIIQVSCNEDLIAPTVVVSNGEGGISSGWVLCLFRHRLPCTLVVVVTFLQPHGSHVLDSLVPVRSPQACVISITANPNSICFALLKCVKVQTLRHDISGHTEVCMP